MRQTTQITIEHIVVASDRSYEQVIEALEAQLGPRADWENSARALITPNTSWEQAVQLVEQQLGTSGFTILSKIEPGALLTLSGKPTRAAQYAIGNPLPGDCTGRTAGGAKAGGAGSSGDRSWAGDTR